MEEQQKMLNQYKNFQADNMQNEAIRQMAPMEGNFQMKREFQGFNNNGFNRNMHMGGNMHMGDHHMNDFGNNNKYKTALCNNFESAGFCKFGDNCKFAHGEQDLRSHGNHQSGGFNNRGGHDFNSRGRGGFGGQRGGGFGGQNMGQMQVCRYFQQNGVCKFGDTCKFIHIG